MLPIPSPAGFPRGARRWLPAGAGVGLPCLRGLFVPAPAGEGPLPRGRTVLIEFTEPLGGGAGFVMLENPAGAADIRDCVFLARR